MSNEIVSKCPVCGGKMVVSVLKCEDCDIEIKGKFNLPSEIKSELLSDEDIAFVKGFLRCEGNLSRMAQETGMSYYDMKLKLRSLNIKLGNWKEEEFMDFIDYLFVEESDDRPSAVIIRQMNQMNGRAFCKMLKGDPIEIRLTKSGVHPVSFPDFICKWEVFDAIMEKAEELGGKMYRGDAGAQKGAKIGSAELPKDSIDGFIALKFYGGEIGKATTRRSTYYAAILDWAGLCENCRSDGSGGYIKL